jgi:hypothetical protein
MEYHEWNQDTNGEVHVDFPVDSNVKSKDVDYAMNGKELSIGVRGHPKYFDKEALTHTCFVDDSYWEIDSNEKGLRVVRVVLKKCAPIPWEFLLKREDVPPDTTFTDKCFFDVTADGEPLGRVTFGLYGNTTPKTCDNFKHLCLGDKGTTADGKTPLAYKGASYTPLPIRPRSRGARRSLRTFSRRISPPSLRFQSPPSVDASQLRF